MNVYGLIGYPLGHSFSKKYFTEKFEKMQLDDCIFELYPLKEIKELPSLVGRTNGLKGLAVTVPYKESVIPFLDHTDKEAALIGAVNCICISAGKLKGYNTDISGFERSLVPLLKPHHTKALILGSGGSSKAVRYVLNKLQIGYLVVSRSNTVAEGFITYESLDEKIMKEYTLVINCTPVGMYPDVQAQPKLPYQFIGSDHLLFDLVYNPAQTLFLANGLAQGATVKNGYAMLEIQAEENWKLWNR